MCTLRQLREAMIGTLREMGAVRSDRVAEVFRAVPRHLFTPGVALEEVYTATTASLALHRDGNRDNPRERAALTGDLQDPADKADK